MQPNNGLRGDKKGSRYADCCAAQAEGNAGDHRAKQQRRGQVQPETAQTTARRRRVRSFSHDSSGPGDITISIPGK
jgi:hypothetical protein